jgi:hypothetical protein
VRGKNEGEMHKLMSAAAGRAVGRLITSSLSVGAGATPVYKPKLRL